MEFNMFSFFFVSIATSIHIHIIYASANHLRVFVLDTTPTPSTSTATPPAAAVLVDSLFRPSVPIIILAILTTIFSLTCLLLLYAKHCKTPDNNSSSSSNNLHFNSNEAHFPSAIRKNSGIDQTVIEALPVFRFGSLTGQKEGLECAVCLNRFDATHVLRLLPKCKHAFHVECVDTWLDAHSTCPLCRSRVQPEDILLLLQQQQQHPHQIIPIPQNDETFSYCRVSGRHSSAGERGGGETSSTDSSILQHTKQQQQQHGKSLALALALRRSFDGSNLKRKNNNERLSTSANRKDGSLLLLAADQNRKSYDRRRFEHRIILSKEERWSDVDGSDLLYLRSEMILSDSSRRCSTKRQDDDTNVISTRSVSEITGLSRFNNDNDNYCGQSEQWKKDKLQQRHKGFVSRWITAWRISQPRPSTSTFPNTITNA